MRLPVEIMSDCLSKVYSVFGICIFQRNNMEFVWKNNRAFFHSFFISFFLSFSLSFWNMNNFTLFCTELLGAIFLSLFKFV